MERALRLGCALAVVLMACAEAGEQPPNLLLITVDTLRADRLSPYGYEAADTPSIESLARDGIVFESAFCDVTWTLPSIASVMTGSYASHHGVRKWVHRLGDEQTTLAELLQQAGYTTAAIVGSVALDARFGFDQGFDSYDDEMEEAVRLGKSRSAPPDAWFDGTKQQRVAWFKARQHWGAYRTDDRVADRAIEWLDGNDTRPFFLWVHFFGPHERDKPAKGGNPEWVSAQIESYDDWVSFTDEQVGRLLQRLRRDPRGAETAVIFHSDHGQDLKEHGRFGHGETLYDTSAHIPLIVALPGGQRAGERAERLVRNLDIFATIVELAGLDTVPTAGRDLLAPHDGGSLTYLETTQAATAKVEVEGRKVRIHTALRGVRTPAWKLVVAEPRPLETKPDAPALPAELVEARRWVRLFHVAEDPGEEQNLAKKHPEKADELVQLLAPYLEAERGASPEVDSLDDATRERLQSIGYLEE